MKLSDEFIECILYETKNAKEHADYLIECGPLRSAFEELKSLREKERWIPMVEEHDFKKGYILVTNNIEARTAFGTMSHVWVALTIIKEPNGTFTACDKDGDGEVYGVTHWKSITPPQEGS